MALDELGIDPYQRAAITFSRRSVAASVVLLIAGGACWHYGSTLGEVGSHLVGAGATACIAGFVLICASVQKLSSEGLSVRDAC